MHLPSKKKIFHLLRQHHALAFKVKILQNYEKILFRARWLLPEVAQDEEVEDNFGNGFCAPTQRQLWNLFENPHHSKAAKVSKVHVVDNVSGGHSCSSAAKNVYHCNNSVTK